MRMVKTLYVRSLALTERLILNSSCTQARKKKKRREMLTSLQTLRDIHVCSTGLYKLSQKGLWSDTSPWCSLSERARTLIYNSLLVTRLTPIFFFFFFAKRNAGCQCCYLIKVSVNLTYFYVLISPLSPPTPTPLPEDFYNPGVAGYAPALSYKISMCNQMVTSEKARKIIRIWTKRKWKYSLFS